MIFDFLVFTLSFHSSACFLMTLIDSCSPSGEGLKTNKSSAYMRQFREWLPSITPGQWSSLKYCGKSFINNENKTGLKPSPCLIPLLHENISVIELSSVSTQLLIDEYMDLMTLKKFAFNSILVEFIDQPGLPHAIKRFFIIDEANIKFLMLFFILINELL